MASAPPASSSSSSPLPSSASSDEGFDCCICLEQGIPTNKEVHLPCCGWKKRQEQKQQRTQPEPASNSSSEQQQQQQIHYGIRYCCVCIDTLARGDRLHMIKCPTCREVLHYSPDGGGKLTAVSNCDTCRCCQQVRRIISSSLCEACHLAMQFPLRYACDTCSCISVIAHPMYRYQPGPNEKTTETWACNSHICQGAQRLWRCHISDIAMIPYWDVPATWPGAGQRQQGQALEQLRQLFRANNSGALQWHHQQEQTRRGRWIQWLPHLEDTKEWLRQNSAILSFALLWLLLALVLNQ